MDLDRSRSDLICASNSSKTSNLMTDRYSVLHLRSIHYPVYSSHFELRCSFRHEAVGTNVANPIEFREIARHSTMLYRTHLYGLFN